MAASEWKAYITVRVGADGVAEVVYQADTIKDARYWLSYIAMPGDALFTTPSHPKYAGNGAPTYMSHLVSRGKTEHDAAAWKKQVPNAAGELKFVVQASAGAASQARA